MQGAARRAQPRSERFGTALEVHDPPYGWSQDTVDGALIVLSNAGLVRVTGDDGKPASLPDLPRQKLRTCTFRGETTIITIAQRMPVRGLGWRDGLLETTHMNAV